MSPGATPLSVSDTSQAATRWATSSAIWTVFSAAPLSRLSPTTKKLSDVRVGEVAAHAADDRLVAARPLQRRRRVLDDEVRERVERLERLGEVDAPARRSRARRPSGRPRPARARRSASPRGPGCSRILRDSLLQLHLLVGVALSSRVPSSGTTLKASVLAWTRARPCARPRAPSLIELVDVLADRRDLRGRARRCPSGPRRPRPGSSWRPSRSGRSASCSALAGSIDDHRRAVRVGDDALARVVERVGVDLADDQRDVGVHPERARVVDDDRARRRRTAAPTRARSPPPALRQREVEALDRVVAQRLDDEPVVELLPAERSEANGDELVGRRTRACARRRMMVPTAPVAPTMATRCRLTQLTNAPNGCSGRIVSVARELERAVQRADRVGHAARPGRRRRSGSGEVEIISMLIPFVAEVGEHLGGDARVRLHARRRRSRPCPSTRRSSTSMPSSLGERLERGLRACAGRRAGTVNDMSAALALGHRLVLDDHVDVHVRVGERGRRRGRRCRACRARP